MKGIKTYKDGGVIIKQKKSNTKGSDHLIIREIFGLSLKCEFKCILFL